MEENFEEKPLPRTGCCVPSHKYQDPAVTAILIKLDEIIALLRKE